MHAEQQIGLSRLRFFSRALKHGSHTLITLFDISIGVERGFVSLLKSDLHWLQKYAQLSDAPCPDSDLSFWADLALSDKWALLLKRAKREYLFMFHDRCLLMSMHCDIARSVQSVQPQCYALSQWC